MKDVYFKRLEIIPCIKINNNIFMIENEIFKRGRENNKIRS